MPEFSEYVCSHCDMKFTVPADKKARCPTCLRSQGIIPVGAQPGEPLQPVNKKRVGVFLLAGLVIVGVVGATALFLIERGKGGRRPAPTNLLEAIKAKGVELPREQIDLIGGKQLETAAAGLVGTKKGDEALSAITSGVKSWVAAAKLKPTPPGAELPPAKSPEQLIAGLEKGSQPVSSFQLAALSFALLRAAGIGVKLVELRGGKNQASLFARKRFAVVVSTTKGEQMLTPQSGELSKIPAGARVLSDLQGVAYGLAFRAVAELNGHRDKKVPAAALRRATTAIVLGLKLWPNGAPLLYARGQLNLLSGMISFGVKDLKLALAADPDAAAHYNVGVALLARGQYQNGVIELKKARKLDPDFLPAAIGLARAELQGLSLTKKEELKPTLDRIEKMLEEVEGKVKARKKPVRDLYFLWGQIKLLRRDGSAAVSYFRKEIDAFPASEQPYFALAHFYLRAEKFTEGAALAKKLVSHAPTNPRAHVLLGQFLFSAGKLDAAEKSLRRALQLDPALPQIRLQLGQLLLRQKKVAEAMKLGQEELKRSPNNLAAYLFLAVLYKAQGDDAQAKKLMERALARTKRKKELKKAFEQAFEKIERKSKTPAPTEKKTPAPTEKKTPAPTEKKTPAPTEKKTPAPTEKKTPAPSPTK